MYAHLTAALHNFTVFGLIKVRIAILLGTTYDGKIIQWHYTHLVPNNLTLTVFLLLVSDLTTRTCQRQHHYYLPTYKRDGNVCMPVCIGAYTYRRVAIIISIQRCSYLNCVHVCTYNYMSVCVGGV